MVRPGKRVALSGEEAQIRALQEFDVKHRARLLTFVTITCLTLGPALVGCSNPASFDSSVTRVAEELVRMAEEDQRLRKEFVQHLETSRTSEVPSALRERLHEVDSRNLARMKEVVAEHGWPTVSLVGTQASNAAWLLVQHGDSDPCFQCRVLELLTPLVQAGEVAPDRFAMLTDRVLVGEGKPQLYGTQYKAVSIDGVIHFGPSTDISDPANLSRRRAEMGLPLHSEYVSSLRLMMGVPENAPPLPPGTRSAAESHRGGSG